LESIVSEVPMDQSKSSGPVHSIQAFNNNMTSIERTRAGLKAMREGIADDYFLGCSAIFGPTFGIVDGLRTGGDIGAKFDLYETRCLQNGGNFYLNKSVVNADADYLVVRNKEDEEAERAWGDKFDGKTTYNEAKMWSDYIALFGGPKISSDNLLTLRPERKKLIENSTSYKTASRFIPLDFWNHATNKKDAFNVMLAENEDGVYISIFNWGATDKKFNLSGLENTILVSPDSNKTLNLKGDNFEFDLSSHSSTIVKVEGASFDNLRKSIQLID
jgi:alpha-galactosidase